jgi:hypothetical protein
MRECKDIGAPFSPNQILRQSDRWFTKTIATRTKIPRKMPPRGNYKKTKEDTSSEYTSWGWDRQCDLAYVQAIWELGMNRKVRFHRCVRILI